MRRHVEISSMHGEVSELHLHKNDVRVNWYSMIMIMILHVCILRMNPINLRSNA